ncbi:hypothetical protein BUALT_Bualt03G0155400 [Buddleja alternifolia]|uniref:Retroviral polymerase SH3-like domain-containing protein n=1 Tax=Buddleja alternifolia TaxID=168488 RepID=A0AAV6XUZ2_9LAMI|nr:hypothetical protein BUALT_Bualt03G0155400 [Buddleja alternifolia]
MDFRSKPCVFLGYSPSHHGYRCLDIPSNRLYIARHVRFDESSFPFHKQSILGPAPNIAPSTSINTRSATGTWLTFPSHNLSPTSQIPAQQLPLSPLPVSPHSQTLPNSTIPPTGTSSNNTITSRSAPTHNNIPPHGTFSTYSTTSPPASPIPLCVNLTPYHMPENIPQTPATAQPTHHMQLRSRPPISLKWCCRRNNCLLYGMAGGELRVAAAEKTCTAAESTRVRRQPLQAVVWGLERPKQNVSGRTI